MNSSFVCKNRDQLRKVLENLGNMHFKSFPIEITLNLLQNDRKNQPSQEMEMGHDEQEKSEIIFDDENSEMSTIKGSNAPSLSCLPSQVHDKPLIKKEIDDFDLFYYYERNKEREDLIKKADSLHVGISISNNKITLEGEVDAVETLVKTITSQHYKKSKDMPWALADCVRRTDFLKKIQFDTKTQIRLRRHNRSSEIVNLIAYGPLKEKVELCVQQINFIAEKTTVLLEIPKKNERSNGIAKIFEFLENISILPIKQKVQTEFMYFENKIRQWVIFLFINSQENVTNIIDQLNKEVSSFCFVNILQEKDIPFTLQSTPTNKKGAINVFCLDDSSYIIIASPDIMRKTLKRFLLENQVLIQDRKLRFQLKLKKTDDQQKSEQLRNLNYLVFCNQPDRGIPIEESDGIFCFQFKGEYENFELILGKIKEICEGSPNRINHEESLNLAGQLFNNQDSINFPKNILNTTLKEELYQRNFGEEQKFLSESILHPENISKLSEIIKKDNEVSDYQMILQSNLRQLPTDFILSSRDSLDSSQEISISTTQKEEEIMNSNFEGALPILSKITKKKKETSYYQIDSQRNVQQTCNAFSKINVIPSDQRFDVDGINENDSIILGANHQESKHITELLKNSDQSIKVDSVRKFSTSLWKTYEEKRKQFLFENISEYLMFYKTSKDSNAKRLMNETLDLSSLAKNLTASFDPNKDRSFEGPNGKRMLLVFVTLMMNDNQNEIVAYYPAYRVTFQV